MLEVEGWKGVQEGKAHQELTGVVVYEVISNLWVICLFPS